MLRGPSGSGKTAAVQALTRSIDFEILEWRNPLTNTTALGDYQSGTALFEDFLSRGQRYDSLELRSDATRACALDDRESLPNSDPARRVILVEEDPHTYSNNATALSNFRASLHRYLLSEESLFGLSGSRAPRFRPPIIMIISESAGLLSGSSNDTLSAHRLLGPDILQHPRVTSIEFNPVATTILTKALELVASKARADGLATAQPSPAILQKIAEGGDLRAAIAALEFLCRRQDSSTERGGLLPASKSKSKTRSKNKASTALTPAEAQLINAITPHHPHLDLFHAVGKVVYNKRAPDPADPTHMLSEVDIETIVDDTGHDAYTFIAALHENYVLSCTGSSFVDHLNACTEALSLADLLGTDTSSLHRGARFNMFSNGAASDAGITGRQTDLAVHAGVRGLLLGLPHPVQRRSAGGQGSVGAVGRDAFKMFYPESVRLRSRMDEVRDTARHFMASTIADAATGLGAGAGDELASPTRQRLSMEDMLLVDAPYRALLGIARNQDTRINELAVLCKLDGVSNAWDALMSAPRETNGAGEHSQRALAGYERENVPLDRRKGEGRWKSSAIVSGNGDDEMGSFIRHVSEKCVLSDDDIEDD